MSKIEKEENLLENKIEISEQEVRKMRTFYERAFSKMKKDSLRGAIFIILVATVGAGTISFHHPLNSIGIINTILITIFIIYSYILSVDIMIKSLKLAPKAKDLSGIVKIVGGKYLGILYNIFFFIFLFAVLVSVLLIVSKLTFMTFGKDFLNLFGVDKKDCTFENYNNYAIFVIALFIYLLSLKKDLKAFQSLSLIAFISFIYLVLVIICEFPYFYQDLRKKKIADFNYFQTTWADFFKNLGIIIYAFNCTGNFYGVSSGIARPNRRRLLKVFKRSLVFMGMFFIMIGMAGYLSLGSSLAPSVDLFPFRNSFWKTDYLMTFGRIFLAFFYVICGILNAFPLKLFIMSLFKKKQRENFFLQSSLMLLLFFVTTLFACFFTNVSKYLGLAGSLSCIITAFTIPGIMGLKIGYCKTTLGKWLLAAWAVGLTVICAFSTYFSLRDFGS